MRNEFFIIPLSFCFWNVLGKVVKQDYCDSSWSSWERFWQGVKQDYYDPVFSEKHKFFINFRRKWRALCALRKLFATKLMFCCPSSIVLFLKCSLKRFWQGVKQDYCDSVSSSWERFLEGCQTGLLWLCVHPRPIEDKQWNDINKLIYIIVLCTRPLHASDPGQNQANEKWVT